MALDIRPIHTQDELDAARKLLSPGAAEPEWVNSFVMVDNLGVNGLFCPAPRLIRNTILLDVEPMLVARPGAGSFLMMGWVDGWMRHLALANNIKGYTFATSNPKLQKLAEKYLPVTTADTGTERRYFRIFS